MFVEVVHYYLLHMCNLHHYHLEALQIELSLDIHVRHKLLFILIDYHSTRFYFTCWKFFLNIYHFTYKQHYLYTLESISVMSSLSKLFPRTITHASFYQLHQQRPDPFYFGAIYRVETWLGRCFILEPKTMYEKILFEQYIYFDVPEIQKVILEGSGKMMMQKGCG